MSLKNDIEELLSANVIDSDTAARIRKYYDEHPGSASHRLILIFGVLGALISGMGIILIMAYNWSDLSIQTKSIISFIPLALAQITGAFTLWQRQGRREWHEGSGVALFMAVGACLFLISQIYHFPGNATSLILTWMLLIVPVVYILDAGVVSLLFLVGITWYTSSLSYFSYPYSEAWEYWGLLFLILPYYVHLIRQRPQSMITTLHHWVVPFSLTIILGGFTTHYGLWMYIAYFSMFGMFFILGNSHPFRSYIKIQNGYYLIGQIGSAILLIMLSFKWFWKSLPEHIHPLSEAFRAPEFWLATLFTTSTLVMFLLRIRTYPGLLKEPFAYVFLFFPLCLYVGLISEFAYILVNLIIFVLAIMTIRKGNLSSDFTELNFGLLIVAVLIFSRFFDSNISFLIRGIAFILVGVGFFFVNYTMYRNKVAHEK